MKVGQLLCEIVYGSPSIRTALEAVTELAGGGVISCPFCNGEGTVEEYVDTYGGTTETICPLCGGERVVTVRDIILSYLSEKEKSEDELKEIEF